MNNVDKYRALHLLVHWGRFLHLCLMQDSIVTAADLQQPYLGVYALYIQELQL